MKEGMNRISIVLIMLVFNGTIFPNNWERLVNLRGGWKFSIGDDESWANPKFNDKNWEVIKVPSSWEEEGFHGYNGYAWYRKHFYTSSSMKGRNIIVRLGRIDDVDEVYVNGNLIGSSGTFPPEYHSAYNAWREYQLPEKYLNFDEDNVIAVRVYDSQMEGGIVEGDIGLYEKEGMMQLDYNLAGSWKFKTGDNSEWKESNFNDKSWRKIYVPSAWDAQGYSRYDGFGWYRIKFTMPNYLANRKLVLVLGKIDDIDEVYVNGKLVGSTGSMEGDPYPREFNEMGEYTQFRGYFLPDGLFQSDKDITIAVRVYDGYNIGGIYEGPIGLIEQSKYTKYWKEQKKVNKKYKNDLWDWIFN
jgi:hypothetical protein